MSIHNAGQLRLKLDALDYAHKVWEAFDTPVSLSCHILAKNKEFRQLVGKSVSPQAYVDPATFFADYQSVSLLSKYPFLDTKIDTEKVAFEKFVQAEFQCKETNERFRDYRDGARVFDPHVVRILSNMQRKIALVLGDVPSFETLTFAFGPGAAYGVRKETSVYNKVVATLECTYVFAHQLPDFLAEFPGWVPEGTHNVSLVQGSELTFVPKNAKTDRAICIEPLLNGLYQKGVGTYLRGRLKSFGINLNDQSVNQKLAGEAFDRDLATVDFSMASDTIAYGLVLDLLPVDWFEFLDVARCPRFSYKDRWFNFQKFSSMGNAYTFELETLIFYAMACAVCEELGVQYVTGHNLAVYGDDVIIPQVAFDLFNEMAAICGFKLNVEKSFHNGVFFESCGHDYFLGTLVRPLLLKKKLNKLLPAFYAANTIKRIIDRYSIGQFHSNHRVGFDEGVVTRLHSVHNWVVRGIPKRFIAYGPEGYGDGHLIAEFDESRPTRHPEWDGWWYRTYVE